MPAVTFAPNDEAQLASRLRDGEPDALPEMVRRYSGRLHAVSRSVLADREQAADAVQQAFVQAWRAAPTIDPSRSLGNWLSTICWRASIDRYRRDRRARAALTATGEVVTRPAHGASVEHIWTVHEVRRAIAELPPDERDVVRLAHVEDLSYPQIAERLEIPVGTVKSRAFRAHKKLAGSLGHLRAAA